MWQIVRGFGRKGMNRMPKYDLMYEMLRLIGYEKFTDLQEKAFAYEPLYMPDKNIMITGSTSTGKTLIPILYYIGEFKCKKIVPAMLYAVPYKALALQKKEEIEAVCEKLGVNIGVRISSGDYKENDEYILKDKNENQIIIIIYEKVFTFSCIKEDFYSTYRYLVLDEFGIIDSKERGVKADFILAEAVKQNVRTFVLNTPYVDWRLYIKNYHLLQIKEEKRPVELEEILVVRSKSRKSIWIEGDTSIIQSRSGNKHITTNNIIADICEYCLLRNMSMIIFRNNRTEVVRMACELYKNLINRGLLKTFSNGEIEDYKKELLNNIYCLEEDLNGIYSTAEETIVYQAMMNGIAFHSAILPIEFREYIEHNWGREDAKFKIVFSTETLAFGVNSNVDIVIIADMVKTVKNRSLLLNKNEYNNYIGRAGRLGKEKGYSFAFINSERYEEWKEMQMQPQIAESQFWELNYGEQIFYMLSFFKGSAYIKLADVIQTLNALPSREGKQVEADAIEKMFNQLLENRLVSRAEMESVLMGDKCYQLIGIGQFLRGYIISVEAYQKIYGEVVKFKKRRLSVHFDFLFEMCRIEEFLQNAVNTCGKMSAKSFPKMRRMFLYMLKENKGDFDVTAQRIEKYEKLDETYLDQIRLAIAMQMWGNGGDMAEIYRRTKIPSGIVKKLGENLCFYLEIATALLTNEMADEKHIAYLKNMQTSMYFGVPISVLQVLSLSAINPKDRYQYRSMGRILNFYEKNKEKKLDGEKRLQEIRLLDSNLKLISDENKKAMEKYLGRKLEWVK